MLTSVPCEDIDECPRGVCDQLCTNIPGSYVCDCHPGYELIGDHCQGMKDERKRNMNTIMEMKMNE